MLGHHLSLAPRTTPMAFSITLFFQTIAGVLLSAPIV